MRRADRAQRSRLLFPCGGLAGDRRISAPHHSRDLVLHRRGVQDQVCPPPQAGGGTRLLQLLLDAVPGQRRRHDYADTRCSGERRGTGCGDACRVSDARTERSRMSLRHIRCSQAGVARGRRSALLGSGQMLDGRPARPDHRSDCGHAREGAFRQRHHNLRRRRGEHRVKDRRSLSWNPAPRKGQRRRQSQDGDGGDVQLWSQPSRNVRRRRRPDSVRQSLVFQAQQVWHARLGRNVGTMLLPARGQHMQLGRRVQDVSFCHGPGIECDRVDAHHRAVFSAHDGSGLRTARIFALPLSRRGKRQLAHGHRSVFLRHADGQPAVERRESSGRVRRRRICRSVHLLSSGGAPNRSSTWSRILRWGSASAASAPIGNGVRLHTGAGL